MPPYGYPQPQPPVQPYGPAPQAQFGPVQPAYSYPAYPVGGPSAPGRAPGSKAPLIAGGIVATVVVLALVVGGIVVFGGGSKGGGGGGGQALTQAWTGAPGSSAGGQLIREWTTGSTAVDIRQSGITGYDLATGRKAFTVTPPHSGQKPCAASPGLSSSGIGAVFFGSGTSCDTVAAVNAATGAVAWDDKAKTQDLTMDDSSVFIDGSVVVAASKTGVIGGLKLSNGDELWHYTATSSACYAFQADGTGTVLVVMEECMDSSGHESAKYVAVDGTTGKRLWAASANHESYLDGVVSSSPVVILADAGSSTDENFLVYDSSGHTTATIAASGDAGSSAFTSHPTAVVAGGTLYADSSSGDSAAVSAYSLTTGAALWSYRWDGNDTYLAGLSADGQSPLVSASDISGSSATLAELGAADGKVTSQYRVPGSPDTEYYAIAAVPGGGFLLAAQDSADSGPLVACYKP